jgi:hypothetical protein
MHASARWMITALLATAAVVCVLALAGCGGSNSTPTTGSIAGVTVSTQGGAVGATLTFTGTGPISGTPPYTTTSNGGTGAFAVAAMAPGVYDVTSTVLEGSPPAQVTHPVEVPPGIGNKVTITAGVAAAQNLNIVFAPGP